MLNFVMYSLMDYQDFLSNVIVLIRLLECVLSRLEVDCDCNKGMCI